MEPWGTPQIRGTNEEEAAPMITEKAGVQAVIQ